MNYTSSGNGWSGVKVGSGENDIGNNGKEIKIITVNVTVLIEKTESIEIIEVHEEKRTGDQIEIIIEVAAEIIVLHMKRLLLHLKALRQLQ